MKCIICRFYRQFFLFFFYFILSLISFTLRPGPSIETIDIANDTISTTLNSSNATIEPITIKPFQTIDLRELITNSFSAAFNSNLRSSLNMTQESLERIQLQMTSDLTTVLKNILLLSSSDNEAILTSPNEIGIYTSWYTNVSHNSSDYFTDMYNESILIDMNSTAKTTVDTIAILGSQDDDDWCVRLYEDLYIRI